MDESNPETPKGIPNKVVNKVPRNVASALQREAAAVASIKGGDAAEDRARHRRRYEQIATEFGLSPKYPPTRERLGKPLIPEESEED